MSQQFTQPATASAPASRQPVLQWLGRYPRTRRLLNRLALLLMHVFVVSILISIAAPQRYQLGPVSVSFEGVLKSVAEWFGAYVAWRMTYDGFGAWLKRWLAPLERQGDAVAAQLRAAAPRLRNQWQRWGWRERLVLLVVGWQALLALRSWEWYPHQLAYDRGTAAAMRQLPFYHPPGRTAPSFDFFCQMVREATPPEARILFYGRTPVVRVAYELYPRTVFMLPQDYSALAASWHVQVLSRELTPDSHPDYWQRFLPKESVPAATFIQQRGITYVASFDEYDMNHCRVEPVK